MQTNVVHVVLNVCDLCLVCENCIQLSCFIPCRERKGRFVHKNICPSVCLRLVSYDVLTQFVEFFCFSMSCLCGKVKN